MRSVDHKKAKRWAEKNRCLNCKSEDLTVNQEGAYVDCEDCDWLGASYEAIGALS